MIIEFNWHELCDRVALWIGTSSSICRSLRPSRAAAASLRPLLNLGLGASAVSHAVRMPPIRRGAAGPRMMRDRAKALLRTQERASLAACHEIVATQAT